MRSKIQNWLFLKQYSINRFYVLHVGGEYRRAEAQYISHYHHIHNVPMQAIFIDFSKFLYFGLCDTTKCIMLWYGAISYGLL